MRSLCAIGLATSMAIVLGGSCARAVDTTWTLNGNGTWNTPANWNNGVPNNTTFNATIDDGDSAVTVTLNLNTSIGNLTIGANDTLSFADTFDLTVAGGSVVNNGTISLNATSASNTDFNFTAAVTTLSGSGTLSLGAASQNRVTNSSVTNELINSATHMIAGGGQLGFNGMKITNQGTIDANISGAMMVVDPSNSNASNTGTMRASNGGTLRFQGGVFTNTGGVIRALDGSTVEFNGAGNGVSIIGGTLATAGTGVVRSVLTDGNLGFTDVTLDTGGQLQFGTNLDASFTGTFTNNGTVDQPSSSGTMQANMNGDVTLTGSGVWTMSGTGASLFRSTTGVATTMTNDTQHTIQGTGNIGNFGMGLNNKGTIIANQATPLTISTGTTAGASFITNSGTLRATSGGTLNVQNPLTSTGGAVEAQDLSSVQLNGLAAFDGTNLSTTGSGVIQFNSIASSTGNILDDVTINGLVRFANNIDGVLRGTIINNGTVEQNSTASQTEIQLDGDVTLSGTGVWRISNNANNIVRRLTAGPATAVLTNDAGHTIQGAGAVGFNQIGLINKGLINADQATQMLVNPSTSNMVNQSTGVLRGSGAGGLTLDDGSYDNQGTIEALNGSKVVYAPTGVTSNNVAGVLTGGTWRSVASGGGATVTLRGSNVTQIAAGTTVELNGAGSVLEVQAGVIHTSLDSTLLANAGTLKIYKGRALSLTNGLNNTGTVDLGGAGLADSSLTSTGTLTNAATGTISGHGTISKTILNSGTVRANGGNLQMVGAVIDGQSGTIQVDPGATLDLSAAGGASDGAFLMHNGVGLNLGANNVSVTGDYANANFGVGNAFNARANVTGAGLINAAAPPTQSLLGNVANGTTATAAMNFGNRHVGSSSTLTYKIANGNPALGPSLRGAIQTNVGGANLTDARLTGAGVTASNYGPIANGADTGFLGVTFNATSAGALTGQQVRVVNNFDNVADQTLSITGAAYRYADPTDHTPEPVNFGIIHVGDTAQQALSITNSAPNDGFSERLNASIGSPTGDATTNSGSFSGLLPGSADSTSLVAAINTAIAGVKSGTATISLTSSGTGTSGLADTALASQTVNLSATVNNFAVASIVKQSGAGTLTPTGPNTYTLNLGTIVEGQGSLSAQLGVTNNVAAPADSLAGSFTTAAAGYSLSGFSAFTGLAAGSTQGSMTVTLPSTAAGTIGGTITLAPQSTNPRPFSMNLPNVTVTLTGRVWQAADFDEDGNVDKDDLTRWEANVGTGALHTQGDANGDSGVDGSDLVRWQRQLGSTAPSLAAASAVPEPGSMAYVVALLVVAQVRGAPRRRAF